MIGKLTVRDIDVTVLEDCCAAFTDAVHRAAIEGLRPVATISTSAEILSLIA